MAWINTGLISDERCYANKKVFFLADRSFDFGFHEVCCNS